MLILDIFALHANSAAGKLQVEIACLRYTAPRLMGKGKELSRLGGGIGTRGPGESKLETDRRHIKRRIEALEERLAELERTRGLQKESRSKKRIPTVAIVGYTNAGKSTLLNALTGAGVLAEDKLFATLDPVTRIMKLPEGNEVLLTDTVGFIDRLPHHLVKAFRSTLEELGFADIVLILTDSSEAVEEQMRKNSVTDSLVEEFGGGSKDIVRVYNKIDSCENREFIPKNAFGISAKTGEGVDLLLSELERIVKSKKCVCEFLIPYASMEVANALYKKAVVISSEFTDEGNLIVAEMESAILPQFLKYMKNNN
jgi:GTP-binding protein HflX